MSSEVKISVEVTVEDQAIQASIDQAIKESEHEAQVESGGLDIEQNVAGDLGLQAIIGGIGTKSPAALVAKLAPFLGPVAIALVAPMLYDFIIDILTRPGGLLDTRFKRIQADEALAFQDRQMQYDTAFGYRQIIIQGHQSFLSNNGNFHNAAFREINQGKGDQYAIKNTTIDDKALGIVDY